VRDLYRTWTLRDSVGRVLQNAKQPDPERVPKTTGRGGAISGQNRSLNHRKKDEGGKENGKGNGGDPGKSMEGNRIGGEESWQSMGGTHSSESTKYCECEGKTP